MKDMKMNIEQRMQRIAHTAQRASNVKNISTQKLDASVSIVF